MMITIGEIGQPVIDVSRRLNAASDVDVSQERERDAFERVVDDLALSVSNMDGAMKSLFMAKAPQTYWDVNVYDGRKIFNGRIQLPITFDLISKWTNIRVYSVDKMFWDLCKNQKITKLVAVESEFMTLSHLLVREFLTYPGQPLVQLGIGTLDIDPLYANRPIRDTMDSANKDVGNGGKYSDLDPTLTKEDLLKAICLYYNAEFYIDVEKWALGMRPRMSVITDSGHNLDGVIMGDREVQYDNADQIKYDYVQSYISLPKPSRATILRTIQLPLHNYEGFKPTILNYIVTNMFGGAGLELESGRSDISNDIVVIDRADMDYRFNAVVSVPIGPPGVSKRNVYRWNGHNDYRLVYTINDNVTQTFTDAVTSEEAFNRKQLSLDPVKGKIYYRYDEVKGVWDEPIQQIETDDEPIGNILPILPALRFLDAENENAVISNSIYHIYFFFGNETSLDIMSKQWIDLFRSRGVLRCTVKGTNYKYGDTFVSARAYPGRYAVKKAVNKMMKKETELELVTI